jgi:hypothetical protein
MWTLLQWNQIRQRPIGMTFSFDVFVSYGSAEVAFARK